MYSTGIISVSGVMAEYKYEKFFKRKYHWIRISNIFIPRLLNEYKYQIYSFLETWPNKIIEFIKYKHLMTPLPHKVNCQNPNPTQPQLNLSWVWHENDLTTPPTTTHHPPQTQCRQYLSCYWPDFDETLKVASWEHLEQIPTIKLTFVQATFVLATFVHIRNISAVTDLILMKL